ELAEELLALSARLGRDLIAPGGGELRGAARRGDARGAEDHGPGGLAEDGELLEAGGRVRRGDVRGARPRGLEVREGPVLRGDEALVLDVGEARAGAEGREARRALAL